MQEFVQGTKEWLEFRKNHIGSSDAPVIMEVSPWKTPYQLWEEKVSSNVEPSQTNFAMQRGIDLEPKVRQLFTDLTGFKVSPAVVLHHEKKWMSASLDGIDESKKYAVEIKCPGMSDHEIALHGKVPEKYFPQLMHQMEVLQLEKIYYLSYYSDADYKLLSIERDDAYIKKLLKQEEVFWEYMQELTAPSLTDRDYVLREDYEWNSIAMRWTDNNNKLKKHEAIEKELRKELIRLAGEKNCIGSGVKICNMFRRGNVDYSNIPELKHVDLNMYRKEPIQTWRIDIC